MTYDHVQYDAVDPLAPGMHFLRDALDCENLGITVVDVEDDWRGKEHDHGDDGQEEVYLLVDGSGQLEIDGEEVELEPGRAVRVDPGASRQLSFEEDSTMVIVGAP